ncbi:MAG: Coq4 family protein, partial [Cyanobacteria bacterium P01_C01_bin.73]
SRWQRWVEARWAQQGAHLKNVDLSQIDLQALATLPEGTLGGAYGRHMLANGFDLDEFFQEDGSDNWIGRRASINHDVSHVITGFDASPNGEFGLAAFCLAQDWDMLNVFVLTFVPLEMLRNPQVLWTVAKGFWLGLKSKSLFAYAFEQNWQTPLASVRESLNICSHA